MTKQYSNDLRISLCNLTSSHEELFKLTFKDNHAPYLKLIISSILLTSDHLYLKKIKKNTNIGFKEGVWYELFQSHAPKNDRRYYRQIKNFLFGVLYDDDGKPRIADRHPSQVNAYTLTFIDEIHNGKYSVIIYEPQQFTLDEMQNIFDSLCWKLIHMLPASDAITKSLITMSLTNTVFPNLLTIFR